jgi:hypothetical protein
VYDNRISLRFFVLALVLFFALKLFVELVSGAYILVRTGKFPQFAESLTLTQFRVVGIEIPTGGALLGSRGRTIGSL